jgi:hypothetical protein
MIQLIRYLKNFIKEDFHFSGYDFLNHSEFIINPGLALNRDFYFQKIILGDFIASLVDWINQCPEQLQKSIASYER